MTQEEHFKVICNQATDINEHLPVLRHYAEQCDHVTEMGVRSVVSTFAFIMGKPKTLLSIDLYHPGRWGNNGQKNLELAKQYADETGVNFRFIEGDTREIIIDETDFLFIDTWHVYEQLKIELERHGNKARKYIGFHDTTLFEKRGETNGHEGLWRAIEEFIMDNPQWTIKERRTNNNGLTILERNA